MPLARLAEVRGARVVVVARGRQGSKGSRGGGKGVASSVEVLLTHEDSPLW